MTAPTADAQLQRKIRVSLFLNLLTAVSKSLKFFFYIFASHMLGEKVLGLFVLCWSTVEMANKCLMMGLDVALLRQLAISLKEKTPESFRRTFATALKIYGSFGVVAALLMFPFSGWVAKHLYLKPELQWGLAFLSVSIVCQQLSRLFMNAVMANKNMKAQVLIIGLCEPITWFLAVLIADRVDPSLPTMSFFHAVANFITLLVAFVYFSFEYKVAKLHHWLIEEKVDWSLLRISLPLGMSELTSNILVKLPLFVLGRVLPSAEVATFAISHQVAHSVITLRNSFAGTIYPVIGEYSATKDHSVIRHRLQEFTLWSMKYVAPFFIILMLFKGQIETLLKVSDPNINTYLPILITTLCLFATFANTEFVLMMLQKGWTNFALHCAWIAGFSYVYYRYGTELPMVTLCWIYFAQVLSITFIYSLLALKESRDIHPLHPELILDFFSLAVVSTVAWLWEKQVIPFDQLNNFQAVIGALVAGGMVIGLRKTLKKYGVSQIFWSMLNVRS